MNWNDARPLLEQKLDPANVKSGTGGNGPKGDYIEGWHAIAEANRIFGFGDWSYSIVRLDLVGTGQNQKGTDFAKYLAVIQVKVGDVTREDVGYGTGYGADAHEGATKEAVTDALKRALRTFGNPFGLALYDKTKENVGKPEAAEEQKAEQRLNVANKIATAIAESEDGIQAGLVISEAAKAIASLQKGDPEAFKVIASAAAEFDITITDKPSPALAA